MDFMLDILLWIQTIRTPVFTKIFTGITVLGEEYVAIAILCFIFWCVNKNIGFRICFAYLLSGVTNNAIKEAFHIERPFVLNNELEPIRVETATGYSFPSGHTQGITALCTALATTLRKKWLYILGGIVVLLVAFSRMYLGVHTIADVAGGIFFGIVCVLLANWIFDSVEKIQKAQWLLLLLIPVILGLIFLPSHDYCKVAGTFSSFLLGYVVDQKYIKYKAAAPIFKQILKFVFGMAVLIGIKVFAKAILGETMVADYFRYLLMGVWITIVAPIIFQRIFATK